MELERTGRREGNSPDQLFKGGVHAKIWCAGGRGASEPDQAKEKRRQSTALSQVESDL